MPITRRRLLGGAASLAVAATLTEQRGAVAAPAPMALGPISPELIALNHMAYGPRPGDVTQIAALGGLDAYIEQQLNPAGIDDTICETKIQQARLRIRYTSGVTVINEARLLTTLDLTNAQLWPLRNHAVFQERVRPLDEVRVAMLIRSAYSERQLQQVLVEFWHNHFNVRPPSDSTIAATFPAFHALIRQHCLGNFRTFLEAVGKTVGMMYDLDNVSNRAAGGEGGNENYARELFELQTLGSDNYLKFYDDRRNIGTVTYNGETFARGYIDEDVYEAARCFAGWTISNGHWEFPATPDYNTGEFLYWPNWHENASKTVLSPDGFPNIPRNQASMKDGQDVYDLTGYHIGTARTICTKLCRRFLADYPSTSVIEAAVAEWMANRQSPDQIARVMRVILTSGDFRGSWGLKVKRPFEFLVSFIRGAGVELVLTDESHPEGSNWGNILGRVRDAGHGLFEWPTPTGYPDLGSYWANTNGTLRRWSLPHGIAQNGTPPSSWEGNAPIQVRAWTEAAIGAGASCEQIVDYWIERLFGYEISAGTRSELIAFLAQGKPATQPPTPLSSAPDWNNDAAVTERLSAMLELMAMAPEFQRR
jgi:uncharacterized protein (DUF1800 family)